MKKTGLRRIGVVLGVLAVLLLALGVYAGATIAVDSGYPQVVNTDWVWQGTATLTNPHTAVCVRFPDVAVSPVACTGTTTFTCTVPVSAFSGVTGSTSWELIGSNQPVTCGGNTVVGASGTFAPTAVSLAGFGASTFNGSFWFIALLALALLTGAVLFGRRRFAVQKA